MGRTRKLDDAEQAEFRRQYSRRADTWLMRRFNLTSREVAVYADRFRLAKDKARSRSHGVKLRMPRWTPMEVSLLRRLYRDTSNVEVARVLKRSVKSIVSRANRLGLSKTDDYLSEMGRANRAKRH